ncbi:hypothetical protein Tco_0011643 [Tanacetum coccineum]
MERFFQESYWRLINSGMSSNSKVGLGYEIQSNNEVLSYEEEMNFSVFKGTEEDSVGKPLYSRFIKQSKKGPQEPEPSVSDDRSSEYSTCQSNDSAGSIRTSSEHSVDLESEISRVPSEVYVSTPITTTKKVNNWNAMMEKELGEGLFQKKEIVLFVPVPTRTSNSFSPKRPQGNWGSAVKTSAGYNWRNSKPNSNCDSGPTFIRTVNAKGPQGRPKPVKAWEKDKDVELIVVPSAVKNTKEKVKSRTSSTNSKKEEILTEPQQEKKASSTDTSEDNPKI